MPSLLLRLSALFLALGLSACDDAARFNAPEPGEARAGGGTTVDRSDRNSFSLPSANLSPERRLDFSVGNSFSSAALPSSILPRRRSIIAIRATPPSQRLTFF